MLLFLNLGVSEVMVIALFVLMFFGSKQIPDLMRGLGRATREFKDAMSGIEREVRNAANVPQEEVKKIIEAPVGPPKEGSARAEAQQSSTVETAEVKKEESNTPS